MNALRFTFSLLVVATLCATPSQADNLLGKQLRVSGEQPLGNPWGGQIDATVGPGIEYPVGPWCCNSMDVTADQIIVDFNSSAGFSNFGSFNGWVFRDVTDNFRNFFDVRLNAATNIPITSLSFNGNEIFLNMDGKGFNANSLIVLDVVIPEPTGVMLAVLAVGAIASRRPRRRAS